MSVKRVYAKLFERIRQIRREEFDLIVAQLGEKHFKKGLEIGCGDGTQSMMLKSLCDELISTDLDSSDIPPERLKQMTFVPADASSLPFDDAQFDLVFSSNVLEHVVKLDRAMSEMKRVLKKDGLMIHVLPNAIWKFLQVLLWIPFRIKCLVAKIFLMLKLSKDDVPVGEFGSSERGNPKRVRPAWYPPVHGVAKTHLAEFGLFQISRWRKKFIDSGFKVEKSFGLKLYSAWNVGPSWIREFLERIGIKSSHCFFLVKR